MNCPTDWSGTTEFDYWRNIDITLTTPQEAAPRVGSKVVVGVNV
jgi:hypothetical protein